MATEQTPVPINRQRLRSQRLREVNFQGVIEIAHDAAAVVAQYATISARVIAELRDCRVIARYGTCVDIVDVEAATRHDILVTNVPNDWCENEVADHATALVLAVARKINVYDRATRAGTWRWQSGGADSPPARERPGPAVVWRHRPGGRGPRRRLRHADHRP